MRLPNIEAERRAVVQRSRHGGKPDGTIAWSEHLEAFAAYAKLYGHSQSAERINERGGFSYGELVVLLDREPTTWQPRGAQADGLGVSSD